MACDTLWYFGESYLSHGSPSITGVTGKRWRISLAERFMNTLGRTLLVLLLAISPAWAALGQPESSVDADGQYLHGRIHRELHDTYRLLLITDPTGTQVREFVTPKGLVFGISWQGPFVPSMQQLLGTHFAYLRQFAQAQKERRGGPLMIQTDDFVFTSGGRMRAYHGRAFLPNLLPPGVSPEVVQ